MEISEKPDGSYEAHCPELSLTAHGRFAEDAIDRLKELVFSSMAGSFDGALPEVKAPDLLKGILANNTHCYLYLPSHPRIH
ncbi:MAG: hypothetical protein NTZ78_08935 [Candidatus Aureabacteria bacterium]|nr:hypothetical protein [Candidatus Auribacterota bacterium]